jgi:seryl-tRNA synthetase
VIDLKRLRDDAEYRAGVERKRVREGLVDEVLALDGERAAIAREVQELRTRQNAASKEIGKASADERPAKIEAAAALKADLQVKDNELTALEARLRELVLQVPNPADASAPHRGEDD